jgi:hypothetical protein
MLGYTLRRCIRGFQTRLPVALPADSALSAGELGCQAVLW